MYNTYKYGPLLGIATCIYASNSCSESYCRLLEQSTGLECGGLGWLSYVLYPFGGTGECFTSRAHW